MEAVQGVSRLPRPKKKTSEDEQMRPLAAVLYKALQGRPDGLSWIECFALWPSERPQVGMLVIWMRSKGVPVSAIYVNGQTRFVLK